MRKNYFAKIIKYMKNVYNIDQNLRDLRMVEKILHTKHMFFTWWKSNRGSIMFNLYRFEYCAVILSQKDKEIIKNASRIDKAIN